MRVKLFDEEHELDLEEDINQFLEKNPMIELVGIQFSTCCAMQGEDQIFCFSALIQYENKK
ncbi:sporulation protein Cse60 [Merdibacter massiliensis]|uniref:sporulation protein Cse60 n=1 Tax=Merdibacter massiliensis TaxID=1871030 RepID=UPI00096A9B33|nr:sporulation protein Cse60 [Merdibacter massiliensis]